MRRVRANGIDTAVRISGSGPPLVLLHGAEADHSMFDALATELERNFTVVAPDQRDSGGTCNPAGSYSFADLAGDVAALIDALGWPRAHVFGQSYGGMIAQTLALRHAQVVDHLVLSSTMRIDRRPSDINPVVMSELAALRAELPLTAPELAGFFFPAAFLDQNVRFKDMFARPTRSLEQQQRRAASAGPQPEADLAAIAAPTLVLAGGEDRLVPPGHAEELAQEIPGGRVQILPGLGHIGVLQDPAAVARAVTEFLRP